MSHARAFGAVILLWSAPFLSLAAPKPVPCAASKDRQFDFWIGDWDVSDVGDPQPSMRIRVERILDGCALKESYRDVNGMVGRA